MRIKPFPVFILLLTMVLWVSGAHADVFLGPFNFNGAQFGNSLWEQDGGAHSASNWLNTVNADPGNPGYLTGANFETGIANIGLFGGPRSYNIGYDNPLVNVAGPDFGVVVARFSTNNFLLALSGDGVNFTADATILASTAIDTSVQKSYYWDGKGPFEATLYVHPIDISDFGFPLGATISHVWITGKSELDLIRAAGFVPLPASVYLMGIGLAGLWLSRRWRKS